MDVWSFRKKSSIRKTHCNFSVFLSTFLITLQRLAFDKGNDGFVHQVPFLLALHYEEGKEENEGKQEEKTRTTVMDRVLPFFPSPSYIYSSSLFFKWLHSFCCAFFCG